MTTPLQQAAQALIDRWGSPFPMPTGTLIAELRKALGAELQQSVEPFAYVNKNGIVLTPCETLPDDVPLYLHPAPQPQLRECWYESDELKVCRKCGQLHDKAITPPQQAKKQVPITDDQIIATFCTTPDFRQYVSAFKAGVKLAEKYHGIGGQS